MPLKFDFDVCMDCELDDHDECEGNCPCGDTGHYFSEEAID